VQASRRTATRASRAHSDDIGGATSLEAKPTILAHAETNRLLARDSDPSRSLATVTFADQYRLSVGCQMLELSYQGKAHLPGHISIYAPKQRVLMVVDVAFPAGCRGAGPQLRRMFCVL